MPKSPQEGAQARCGWPDSCPATQRSGWGLCSKGIFLQDFHFRTVVAKGLSLDAAGGKRSGKRSFLTVASTHVTARMGTLSHSPHITCVSQ